MCTLNSSHRMLSYSDTALCVPTDCQMHWVSVDARLGLVLYAVSCVLLPFSNQITGPIPNMSTLNASLSYSGSGSGSGFQNSTTFDYCENDLSDEMHANINSVIRIPIYVWVVVVITLLVMMVSRYVHQL